MTHVSDEFLSALLDQEAAPASDDAAHVDGCAQCQERLGVLRGVAQAVAAPTPPPAAHLREAAVSAALVERGGATATLRRVVASNRRRVMASRSPARRISPLSAAAALVIALAVGGWAISQTGSGTGSDGATFAQTDQRTNSATADLSGTQTEQFAPGGAGGGAADSGSASGTETPMAADETSSMIAAGYDAGAIGSYSDIAAVANKASQDLDKSPEEKAEHPYVDTPPCAVPEGQGLEWHASLTFDGVDAYARVLSVTASTRVLQVLARTDCAELASQELAPTTPR
jgi:hypothetical protein